MKTRLTWGFVATALLAAVNGCAAPSAITRGQSTFADPAFTPAGRRSAESDPYSSYQFDGATYGGDPYSAEGNEYGLRTRQYDRFQAQGIIPPPGSPYAGGYMPSYTPGENEQAGRMVGNVPVYDGVGGARDLEPLPMDQAYRRRQDNGYHDFMPGGCPQCGADYIRRMPTHHSTFAYHRPADLSYPGPNSVGGAVVYSYYTLKGPADFFYTGE